MDPLSMQLSVDGRSNISTFFRALGPGALVTKWDGTGLSRNGVPSIVSSAALRRRLLHAS